MEFDVMTRATTWDNVAALARRTEAAASPACCSPRAIRYRG
jgi:hypothetical protein